MKNNEVPEGESDNPKGDPDDETSGEDTLETDGGGEALEGTSDPPKNEPQRANDPRIIWICEGREHNDFE
jgi:hypothetical protein